LNIRKRKGRAFGSQAGILSIDPVNITVKQVKSQLQCCSSIHGLAVIHACVAAVAQRAICIPVLTAKNQLGPERGISYLDLFFNSQHAMPRSLQGRAGFTASLLQFRQRLLKQGHVNFFPDFQNLVRLSHKQDIQFLASDINAQFLLQQHSLVSIKINPGIEHIG